MEKIKLKIVLGQINPIVGDISHNSNKIIKIITSHQEADIIIFPEMALVGYPLMDHIHDPLVRKENTPTSIIRTKIRMAFSCLKARLATSRALNVCCLVIVSLLAMSYPNCLR